MNGAVSVIIPTYGRATQLLRAIESVRAQPGPETEIVVVDDGTPGGLDRDGLDDRVRVIRNETNVGPGVARNIGAAHATHEILTFLDSDDEWLPASLRPRLALLRAGTCVVGPYQWINDQLGTSRVFPVPDDVEDVLRRTNVVHPSTILLARRDFERAGGFPEDRDCAEDWVFLLRVLAAGVRVGSVTTPVVVVHVNAHNTTRDAEVSARHALGAVRHIHTEALLTPEEAARTGRLVSARVAGFYANAALIRPAAQHIGRALSGSLDIAAVGALLQIPVQALRGVLRRRREAALVSPKRGELPPATDGAVVLASSPSEAWLASAVAGAREALPEARLVVVEAPGPPKRGPIDLWRVRRSGEPDARELRPLVPDGEGIVPAADLAEALDGARLIVDLSGSGELDAAMPGRPPVLRPGFGPKAARSPELGFDAAYLTGRRLDQVQVVLETCGSRSVIRSSPAVIETSSRALTANAARWKAATTIPRALRGSPRERDTAQVLATSSALPGSRFMASTAWVGRAAASFPTRLLMREHWDIAIQPSSTEIPATDTAASAPTHWLEDSCALADPHLLDTPEGTYLFVERIHPGAPATIAASRLDERGQIVDLRDVLVRDWHLSYPCVFLDDGVAWMLPEMSATRRVQLFRADALPHRWTAGDVILSGISAFDPTIHRNDDGYWLWAGVAPFGRGRNDELWLFHSPSLSGPWRPHAQNPVIDDPGRARPAGALFVAEGRLIRPSQDCSAGYGRRIVLNEVRELSRTRYVERPVATIDSTWCAGLSATHTIARSQKWMALDGARPVFDPLSSRHGAHL